jgi:hypothetical protein
MNDKKPVQWLEKYNLLNENDATGLEHQAAIHELRNGLPRNIAEERAHKDYLGNHARNAAAHHYQGMKLAQAVGAKDHAEKHGLAFINAMKYLGKDPHMPLDEDIKGLLEHQSVYKFKGHSADHFFAPEEEPKEKPKEEKK